ncbi:MAG: tRNA guanosine(15) transglycosylase TgtA [Candidatus Thorarchaeota archaeon]
MSRFEIKAKDGMARLGKFSTEHGTVKTPLLMPVVHPGKSEIKPSELVTDFGFQMIITNSYIIKSQDKYKDLALEQGVHGLLDFEGPIMTDSGTFQMYFHDLPKEEINPLEIIDFQKRIGSDIGTILDAFSDPDVGKKRVEEDVQLSLERARISVPEKGDMLLAGTIQGGIYPDLREESAKAMAKLDFDVYPIGGVVPMMERYRYADMVRAILAAKRHLPVEKPVHLFGCGHPMIFAQSALLGCDFFDSASYAKFADSGRMLLPTGTVHLENLTEMPCECPVCSSMRADELKNLKQKEQTLHLMKHNLFVTAAEIRRVRQAISEGKLMELAAIRARGHPELYEAFQVMLNAVEQIMKADPIGNTKSILYTGSETSRLPIFQRFHRQITKSYPYRNPKTLILIPDMASTPFSEILGTLTNAIKLRDPSDAVVAFVTPVGVIPWELEHIHPAQQCVFPATLDPVSIANIISRTTDFIQAVHPQEVAWVSRSVSFNDVYEDLLEAFNIEIIEGIEKAIARIETYPAGTSGWERRKLGAIFAYQWGVDPKSFLSSMDIQFKVSRSTGKIRYIEKAGEILFTLVPTTGLLTPTYKGGRILQEEGINEHHLVKVDDDAAEFVAKGKSALAKFVTAASPNLLAGEEVLIIDGNSSLLGTGRALLTGPEMLAFSRGVAVVPRHSRD